MWYFEKGDEAGGKQEEFSQENRKEQEVENSGRPRGWVQQEEFSSVPLKEGSGLGAGKRAWMCEQRLSAQQRAVSWSGGGGRACEKLWMEMGKHRQWVLPTLQETVGWKEGNRGCSSLQNDSVVAPHDASWCLTFLQQSSRIIFCVSLD